MDETCIQVKGVCNDRYRAVYKPGKTVGFLLTATRDMAEARSFADQFSALAGMVRPVSAVQCRFR